MRLHENWELFSDALQAASQPVEDGGLIGIIVALFLGRQLYA
jgi:hypothetical protein